MPKGKIIQNLRRCPRFNNCSANICPLDLEANQRVYIKGEDICPFTIKRRKKSQEGIRTLAPNGILKFVPKLNVKMLNNSNQKRWVALLQKPNSINKTG